MPTQSMKQEDSCLHMDLNILKPSHQPRMLYSSTRNVPCSSHPPGGNLSPKFHSSLNQKNGAGNGMKGHMSGQYTGQIYQMPAKDVYCCFTVDALWLVRATANVNGLESAAALCANVKEAVQIILMTRRYN